MSLSRYIVLAARGVHSETYPCPKDYALIQKARYLGVAPWELLERSIYWQDQARIAMNAEAEARKTLRNHR